ncbi:MAG: phosphoribosyltransferase family protein [bacterium]|nr:phosphoribosyltransferase family protein [bacterium]
MIKTNYPLVKVDWNEVKKLTQGIADKILSDNKDIDLIVPIIRGGMPIAMLLSSMLGVEEMSCIHIRRSVDDNPNTEFKLPVNKGITNADKIKNSNILIVDDTLDSKVTLDYAINLLNEYQPKNIAVAILYNFNKDTFDSIYSGEEVKEYKWVVFPWEKSEN